MRKKQKRKRFEYEKDGNTIASRARRLICAAQRRAKKKRLQITLRNEDISPALKRGVCEITGIPFVMVCGEGTHPYSPTLDRIDPNVGYIPTNVRVVVHIYNACRNEWGDAVVIDFAKRLLQVATDPTESSLNPTKPHLLGPVLSFRA